MIDASRVKQQPTDRVDIIVRVFNIKLKELLQDIVKGKRFGETLACWYIFLTYVVFIYYFLT
jgi:hypothetical protein